MKRTGFRPYEMKPCDVCQGDRPHTPKGQCVACDQRAKATTPGRRVYQQGRALQRAKKAAGKRSKPRVSPTKQAAADALPIAQAIVKRRAKGRCELCGAVASPPYRLIPPQHHHRKPRQMGGSSSPAVNTAANLLYLHPGCHQRVEEQREWAYRNGFLLFQSADPTSTPVRRWDGWVLLGEDGSMTRVDPPDEEVS